MSALRSGRRWLSSGLLALVVLTGCASQEGAGEARSTAPASDARLLGLWRVTTVHISGEPSLQADQLTKASVQFRRDGRVIANGEPCGALHFTTAGGAITLTYPKSARKGTEVCTSGVSGSDVALRIYSIVDRIAGIGRATGRSPITYAVRDEKLTLARGRYRLELRRGPAADQPASISAAPASS